MSDVSKVDRCRLAVIRCKPLRNLHSTFGISRALRLCASRRYVGDKMFRVLNKHAAFDLHQVLLMCWINYLDAEADFERKLGFAYDEAQ
jgi:hypothetical protein